MMLLGRRLLPALLSLAAATAQAWTDEQLLKHSAGLQSPDPAVRLQQISALVAAQPDCVPAIAARIHGDHREYLLKVERLLAELTDDNWQVREAAERTLIEIGGRARSLIERYRDHFEVLEQQMRCSRILDALAAKNSQGEAASLQLLRGLVECALYLHADPQLLRALHSALGHTDAQIVDGALRALGRLGDASSVPAVQRVLAAEPTSSQSQHQPAALAALARMAQPAADAVCRERLTAADSSPQDIALLLRALASRQDAAANSLREVAAQSPNALLAAAAPLPVPTTNLAAVTVTPLGGKPLPATLLSILGDSVRLRPTAEGQAEVEFSLHSCDQLEFATPPNPTAPARVFLGQGTLVTGELLTVDANQVKLRSPIFGEVSIPRASVQGIALDPALDRLIGASPTSDRVRLMSGELLDGNLLLVDATNARLGERAIARASLSGLMFQRPTTSSPDESLYARVDHCNGDRLLGFLCACTGSHLSLAVPGLGVAVLDLQQVCRIEFGIGGGALWGFTVIADYSDNCVIEVDEQARTLFRLDDIYAVWDAECLDNGNFLLTEYAVSRVREVNRKGEDLWVFEDLKNPYDADRLPNGNVLIADTFGMRVIEVNQQGKVVWKYDQDVRPFDVERLANGNTLIADMQHERVVEITATGEVVWEQVGMAQIHDADRLPNGNTLVTLRSKGVVMELDRTGRTVWELSGLSAPSDADRLPNGHTLVAENNRVREFDRRGTEVWRKDMMWAVEVNRY